MQNCGRVAGTAARRALCCLAALPMLETGARLTAEEPVSKVELQSKPGSVSISIAGRPFATFYYNDKTITRPYFAHVHAPSGEQVTRNHPPVEGRDLTDHATFHPGIWMSFGDINGSDYWRIKAPVKFEKFLEEPHGGTGSGGFKARYSYRDQKSPENTVCFEELACEVRVVPAGFLLLWDSTFSCDKQFAFGDQEEMGLGFRMATPLRAERKGQGTIPPGNGEIVNSRGARNEKEVWGNAADWCNYTGEAGDRKVGIAILCHPQNFRPSWFHARDYGLLEANPFGRAAFGKGEPSSILVKPGASLRLRYGVLVHSSSIDKPVDIPAAYQEYVKLSAP
jgi:hypothetical protein